MAMSREWNKRDELGVTNFPQKIKTQINDVMRQNPSQETREVLTEKVTQENEGSLCSSARKTRATSRLARPLDRRTLSG